MDKFSFSVNGSSFMKNMLKVIQMGKKKKKKKKKKKTKKKKKKKKNY